MICKLSVKVNIIKKEYPKSSSFQFVTIYFMVVSAFNKIPPATETFKLSMPSTPGIVIEFVMKFRVDSLIP